MVAASVVTALPAKEPVKPAEVEENAAVGALCTTAMEATDEATEETLSVTVSLTEYVPLVA